MTPKLESGVAIWKLESESGLIGKEIGNYFELVY